MIIFILNLIFQVFNENYQAVTGYGLAILTLIGKILTTLQIETYKR